MGFYKITCGLANPIPESVTFALNDNWMTQAIKCDMPLQVFCFSKLVYPISDNIQWIPGKFPLYNFALFHNGLDQRVKSNNISETAILHSKCNIGNDGMRYVKSPDGDLISIKHIGNVLIHPGVEIGAFSTVARGVFDHTVIEKQVRIGCGVQIGHNSSIGQRTVIVDGSIILGSVSVGSDCYIGGNSVIRNGVSISSNTMIGMGSVVVKDIFEEGYIWAGNPAKKMKPWNGDFL